MKWVTERICWVLNIFCMMPVNVCRKALNDAMTSVFTGKVHWKAYRCIQIKHGCQGRKGCIFLYRGALLNELSIENMKYRSEEQKAYFKSKTVFPCTEKRKTWASDVTLCRSTITFKNYNEALRHRFFLIAIYHFSFTREMNQKLHWIGSCNYLAPRSLFKMCGYEVIEQRNISSLSVQALSFLTCISTVFILLIMPCTSICFNDSPALVFIFSAIQTLANLTLQRGQAAVWKWRPNA